MEITLESISKIYEGSFEEKPALFNVSARIASGEFFFLLGPSGCGKTTLLRLIAGLLHPTSGRILFDNADVTDLPVDKRDTSLVFQGYALWPHMTVLENVEFGPKMQGVGRSERRELALGQLGLVQMEAFADRKPNQLSGGQQQRVALARALAARTGCLLLDEPLSSLDARLRLHMRDELRTLVKSSGVTAVYVTHDQKEALSMADRIAVMNAGEIVQIGSPEALYNRPATRFVADFLGEANFLDGRLTGTGDATMVETASGEIRCSDDRGHSVGEEVVCCIRPEYVHIEKGTAGPAQDNDNLVAAKVLSSIYLGEIRQFACQVGEGEKGIWRISMLAHQAPSVQQGETVRLRFAADHVALLAR